jgi:glycosyltransferase involved in cell wall biosynthesis
LRRSDADLPLLSVIIPTFNGEAFLAEAVESIRQQAYQPLEIVVVDDGSTDRTAEVALALGSPLRYVCQPHHGRPAVGRNRGLQLARGTLIGFLDQDDLWAADKLAVQVPRLLDDPALEIVIGRTQPQRLVAGTPGPPRFESVGPAVSYPLLSAALFKRSAFQRVGLFDPTLRFYGDDADWFVRAHERGLTLLRLDQVLLYWRLHGHNISETQPIRDHQRGRDYALTEIVKRALDRRRGADRSPS